MVKIRVFIPHLGLKEIFEEIVCKMPQNHDINIDMTYIYGTTELMGADMDADILVARGMTYDVLHKRFPGKHIIQIQFTSFDILDALLKCREKGSKNIALFLNNIELYSLKRLKELCQAKIKIYDVCDEDSTREAVLQAKSEGADVFVGAGTMCGICDKMSLPHIHIHTKYESVEMAMKEALKTAKTLGIERARIKLIKTMLNNNEDGIVAIDGAGNILAINNQIYRMFKLSTFRDTKDLPITDLVYSSDWENLFKTIEEKEEVIRVHDKNYYVHLKPFNNSESPERGALIFIKNTDRIIKEESKIRKELSEKGLTAKYSFNDILGHSKSIRENILMAEKYSKVNSNVLIIGETGTGKELFAHSIHSASKRSKQPFVALNCAALPESLLESELFGYEAGAFSGAAKGGKMGLFEMAHEGTIFLDEIGEIPIALQAKLLRVLQEREIRRVGSTSVHSIDVRVISATNINIEEKIKEGKFRSDLYYRLNLLDIYIPPLRERKEDIEELVDMYLSRFSCELGKKTPTITKSAANLLKNYDWLGNVRELRNICERLVVLNEQDTIDERVLLQLKIFKNLEATRQEESLDDSIKKIYPKKKKQDIAKELGISRTTLWRMSKKQADL